MNKIISYIRDHTYLTYIYVVAVAVFEAFFSVIFIYPNEFAPAGMPGITVMLQKLTGVSAAIFFFLVKFGNIAIRSFIAQKLSYSKPSNTQP